MSVGLLVVRLIYRFYVFGHLSKWFTFFLFLVVCLLLSGRPLHLLPTVECSSSKGLRVTFLSKYTEVWAGQNAWFTTETLIAATLCYQLAFFLVKRYTFLFINYFYHFVLSVGLCISKVLFFKWDISCFFGWAKQALLQTLVCGLALSGLQMCLLCVRVHIS